MGDGERIQHHRAWFWRTDRPLEVKFAVEKAVRMLLEREPAADGALVYTALSFLKDPSYRVRLRLEGVEPERHLYSLEMEAMASARWFTQEKLDQLAGKDWKRWTVSLGAMPRGPRCAYDRALHDRIVAETTAREEELANRKEDDAAVKARQAVLDAFLNGKRCSSTNKEGMTTFRFAGGRFVRDHMGDWDEREVFPGPEAFLADLRKFYDYEIRRDSYPHSPPEADVWKFLLSRVD